MFKLLRYFSQTSAIVLTVMALLLVWLYREDQRAEYIKLTEEQTALLATSFVNSFWPQFGAFLTTAATMNPEKLRERGEVRAIGIAFRSMGVGLPVLKVKIYTETGKVLYSPDKNELGNDESSDSGFLATALKGKIISGISFRKTFPSFDGPVTDRYVIETYIPVRRPDGALMGVLELYSDVTSSMHRMTGNVIELTAIVIVIFSVLYGTLFLIVRHADGIIRSQHLALDNTRLVLQHEEERFRAIADYTYDWENWFDETAKPRWLNPAVERLVGYTVDECLAMDNYPLPIVHEEDRDRIADHLREACEGNFKNDVEFRLLCKNGTVKWGGASYQPIYSDNDEFIGSRWSVHDITDRKRAEQRLGDSEAKFRFVTQSVADAIVSIDRDGQLVSWNASAEQIFGYSEEDALGRNVTFIMPEEYRERHATGLRNLRETGDSGLLGTAHEFEGLRRNGQRFPLELSLSRWTMENHAFFTAILRDITARKTAENVLIAQTEELERSNAELEQFAYVASHDLQEPLRMVTSYMGLLQKRYAGTLDDQADEFIGFAAEGAKRMQHLIKDLLQYSRVSTGGKAFAPTDFEKVFDLAVMNLQSRIEETQAVITHDPLPELDADESQMVRLLQNVIGNALKYGKPDVTPTVHIFAAPGDGGWTFRVVDNGIGIAPEYFERIFMVFQRLHGRDEYEGTGIGLAVCRKIVDRHGGRIWVESESGEGATFGFYLPETQEAASVSD